jgi:MFS family permease
MIIAGGGLVLMSRMQSLGDYYLAFLTTALGLSLAWLGPPMYVVSNWFIRKRSRALAVLMAGSGLGGLLVPFMVMLIAHAGWRSGLVRIGMVYCLVSIPFAMMLKHRPEQRGLTPDGDIPDQNLHGKPVPSPVVSNATGPVETHFGLKDAVRTRAFWLITISLTLSQFVMTAVYVLEMPHLESIGFSRYAAGITVTWTTLLSLAGSLIGGFWGDILNKRYLLAAAVLLQGIGLFILANITRSFHIAAFVIIYGLGFGATVPLRPALIADYFGRANIGLILGVTMSIILFGSVLSPLIAGWFFDMTGNYRGIFSIYAAILSFGAPAVLAAKRPKKI